MAATEKRVRRLFEHPKNIRFKELDAVMTKKELSYYMDLKYPLEVKTMPDGMYCAEIKAISGLCAYGESAREAVEQLEIVKKTAFELMLEQGKDIPIPTIRLEIPIDLYEKMANKEEMAQFVVV